MVRTVPNTISRRTITQQQPPQYSPSPACTDSLLLNRNNLNRFFDNNYSHPSPSQNYPTSDNPTPPIEDPLVTQNSSRKSAPKSLFLGVLIPKYDPPSIKEPISTGLRRRHKASSADQFSNNHHHQHKQPIKKKNPKQKKPPEKRRVGSISCDSSVEINGSEAEIVSDQQFGRMLDVDQVVVDHQKLRKGDAVFVV
jgi:hypothetical protein